MRAAMPEGAAKTGLTSADRVIALSSPVYGGEGPPSGLAIGQSKDRLRGGGGICPASLRSAPFNPAFAEATARPLPPRAGEEIPIF